MARVKIPVEEGNHGIQSGTLPKVIQQFSDRWNPEAMYFTTYDGERTAYFVFDLADSSGIPQFAEPFFMELHASVEIAPTMNAEDLQRGLSNLK
jgi:hypothetical protein